MVVSMVLAISLASRSYAEARLGHIGRGKEPRRGPYNVAITRFARRWRQHAGKLYARTGTLFATEHSKRPAINSPPRKRLLGKSDR